MAASDTGVIGIGMGLTSDAQREFGRATAAALNAKIRHQGAGINRQYRSLLAQSSFGTLARLVCVSQGQDGLAGKELIKRTDLTAIPFIQLGAALEDLLGAARMNRSLWKTFVAAEAALVTAGTNAPANEVIDLLMHTLGREIADDFEWPDKIIQSRADGNDLLRMLHRRDSSTAVRTFVERLSTAMRGG